jgi:diadenosine tetraphosphatase ApaH/serine/threonine PP2A family protein phosphatase
VRYLILSDIHSNTDALGAVLRHAAGNYDRIVCCGDLIGYAAEPNEVVDWARQNLFAAVRGNHDKACFDPVELETFNDAAREAALWTCRQLTPANLDYLRALPVGPLALDDFQILHGSPLDEGEYLVSAFDVLQVSPHLTRRANFFGHTHRQASFLCRRHGVKGLGNGAVELEPDSYYMFNPGSVGQPRDGDPRAAYLLYSPDQRLVEFCRAPYNIKSAQAKIRQAGLPNLLAERLEYGA